MNPLEQEFRMQEALQQQKIDAEVGVNANRLREQQQSASAALVEQINPDKVLENIDYKLRGLEVQYDGTAKKVRDPLLNDKGIGEVLLLLSSVVNQNTIFSALDEGDVGRLMVQISNDLIDALSLNWKEWGIKQKYLLDLIVDICLTPCFMALKRAVSGGERRFLGTTTTENITSSASRMPRAQKQNFMSRFKL